ncbi:MAG: hypothetical protein WD490_10440 [Opitutales bacterium]
MNLLWISGWGLPAAWLKERVEVSFPGNTHTVIPPSREAVRLLDDPSGYDRIAGYSLGAFLLLQSLAMRPERYLLPGQNPIALLSPFFSFPAENGNGGRIPRAQVTFLARWIKREPLPALIDFYRRSGLTNAPVPAALPYPIEELLWGLEQLTDGEVDPLWSTEWVGLGGADDPLLDTKRLKVLAPSLQILPEAGHGPEPMLAELRKIWNPHDT